MRFDVMTLFPEMIEEVLGESIIGRAQANGKIEVYTHQIRDFGIGKHRRVDDTPYGGGKGMLMMPGPIYDCYRSVVDSNTALTNRRVIYMSPQGAVFDQKKAEYLSTFDNIIILCGHYEGIDRRIIDEIVDEEISIGDYVLTGGELPACIVVDCVSRLCDGVLSDAECFEKESISCGMLEYPQYTRPPVYHGMNVPDVLLNGNHADIEKWRHDAALQLTIKQRRDLIF